MNVDQVIKDYNDAINFAIKNQCDGGLDFLRCWREGDWVAIDEEWPDFVISDSLRNPNF